jgi:hypothetical protein
MKGINKILSDLVVDGFSQDISPHSISAEIIIKFFITEVDQGHHLRLLHCCRLHYDKEGNRHDGMDNSLGNVEVKVFTVFATIIGAERFEMTGSLTLETYAMSHIQRKDFVNK